MARTMVVDSATAQFFINVVDNASLNHRDNSPAGFGYAVFGKVIERDGRRGQDKGRCRLRTVSDVPVKPVIIESVKREK